MNTEGNNQSINIMANVASTNSTLESFVQIYILSRDRADFCREAVQSAVDQCYLNYEIIISDNSECEDVSEMLCREFPHIRVIRRKPTLSGFDHFNKVIEDSNAPLIVLFHDDDILERNYLSKMVSIMKDYPEISAAGCNANIIRVERLTSESFMGDFSGVKLLNCPNDLVDPYFSLSLSAPAPLPGYMYRTKYIKNLRFDISKGGKHADASFLASILKNRGIIWTSEKLIRYRSHSNNWSVNESIADRISLLRFFYSIVGMHPKSKAAIDYKFAYWLKWLINDDAITICSIRNLNKNYRKKVVFKFVFLYALRASVTRLNFWRKIIRALTRLLSSTN